MTGWRRWWKFNLVGAMGMGVQLSALALLTRLAPGHYLWASAAAVELAVLHNFVWHRRYTWRDRMGRDETRNCFRGGSGAANSGAVPPLVRFHLSNGLVSVVGNLVLMRLLVRDAHMPVLLADSVAIVCCSVLNFALGDLWAFAGGLSVEA